MLSLTVIMHGNFRKAHRSSRRQTAFLIGCPVKPAASVKYSWLSYMTGNLPQATAGANVSRSLHQIA